jgi:hypothetical protein
MGARLHLHAKNRRTTGRIPPMVDLTPMAVDIAPRASGGARLSEWSAAEFADTLFADGLVLRALICRLGVGEWQWSISSLDGDRGELICIGTEKSSAKARRTVASEMAKCLEDPFC